MVYLSNFIVASICVFNAIVVAVFVLPIKSKVTLDPLKYCLKFGLFVTTIESVDTASAETGYGPKMVGVPFADVTRKLTVSKLLKLFAGLALANVMLTLLTYI